MYRFMLDLQGSICLPCSVTVGRGAVALRPGQSYSGENMSLVICAVGNSSFHCVWEFIAEDIQDSFYTDMLLNLKNV
jgi:hypothetical protein